MGDIKCVLAVWDIMSCRAWGISRMKIHDSSPKDRGGISRVYIF